MKNIFFFTLVILFSLIGVDCKKGPPDGPPLGPDTTSHAFTWTADTIGIYPSYLHGVWGTDINNVYAVGFMVLSNPPSYSYTAIMHWDGVKWSSSNYLEGYLEGIYGFGANDIWSVGSWWVDNNAYALITHWDGKTWTSWKLQQYDQLFAIWGTSSSNLYAVGWAGLILHYDGNTWTQQQSGTELNLRSVWGIDNLHIFAAGQDEGTGEGVLLQLDATGWKTIVRGGINADSTTLYGEFWSVWGNSISKLFLVGALSYEGTQGNWTLSDIPYNSPGQNLIGLTRMNTVYGNTSNNVFICGDRDLIIHWNGSSWHIYNQFFDKTKQSSLQGIWIKDKTVFISGDENNHSQAIIYRGTH